MSTSAGECPYLPGNAAHVDMCRAQKGWPPKIFKNAKRTQFPPLTSLRIEIPVWTGSEGVAISLRGNLSIITNSEIATSSSSSRINGRIRTPREDDLCLLAQPRMSAPPRYFIPIMSISVTILKIDKSL